MAIPSSILTNCEKNNFPLPEERVVCAAIRLPDGLILTGARHWDDVMSAMADKLESLGYVINHNEEEHGFINQWGVFLTREEAMDVALTAGQLISYKRNGGSKDQLFSEGLY